MWKWLTDGGHVHKWANWHEVERGSIGYKLEDGRERVTGNYIRQERACLECGYKELRMEQARL